MHHTNSLSHHFFFLNKQNKTQQTLNQKAFFVFSHQKTLFVSSHLNNRRNGSRASLRWIDAGDGQQVAAAGAMERCTMVDLG